jgi:hypothetical protein
MAENVPVRPAVFHSPPPGSRENQPTHLQKLRALCQN